MSSFPSMLVIGIFYLIIVAVAAVWLTQKHLIHLLGELDKHVDGLQDIAAADAISRLEKMELAGESLDTFVKWRKTYQELSSTKRTAFKKQLTSAAELVNKYKLFAGNREIKAATTAVDQAREDLSDAKAVFKQLLESNRDNQIQYDSLLKTYHELRKEVLAKSFDYGTAMPKIEEQLSTMEKDFAGAKNLSNQGDHVEAKRVLSRISENLATLQSKLPQLKDGWHELQQVFPAQLDELSSAYKQMVGEKYCIKEVDFPKEIKQLHSEVDASKELLTKMDEQGLATKNQAIADKINSLYDILAKEYHARPFVKQNRDKLIQILTSLASASKQLIDKLKHIDESYELTHGELDEARQLAERVNQANDAYTKDVQAMADGTGVYSEIKSNWMKITQDLGEIENREKTLSQDVDGLFDAEKIAHDSIDRFKQDVSLLYRRVQRRQLPGKPESFVQMYTLVVNEIGKTDEELSQVRINMEKISQELIQIQEDVDRLHREADSIISSADLVERAMQYSNKYLNYGEIKKARAKAMKLYQNEFNYKDALDAIATALEHVEPGSYNRIEKSYYDERKSLNSEQG
ncbi:MAG: septation ring formation regulator EzrA [Lactobacillus sp.]|jgi:septation ring formation regulator|nr:septation ring formation regulator EzrA [Lactobacillus sp.]